MQTRYEELKRGIAAKVRDTAYDRDFQGVPVLAVHPELMPYVGTRYEKYRVLCVGESHYLSGQKRALPSVIEDWYEGNHLDKCMDENDPLYQNFHCYYTRCVVDNYLHGQRGFGYTMFSRPAAAVADILKCGADAVWRYFAFMNYYQRPANVCGASLCSDDEDEQRARETLTRVIEILKPERVIFLSKKAYCAFLPFALEVKTKICAVSHPTSHWWERKRRDGSCAKQDFQAIIREVVG